MDIRTSVVPQAFALIEQQCFERPWPASAFKPDRCHRAWSYWLQNQCLSFLWIRAVADEAEVLRTATLPQARRRGLAKALFLTAIPALQAKGTGNLYLEVSSRNPGAQSFYENLGFKAADTRPNYYAPGEHALNMTLHLQLTASKNTSKG